LRTLLAFPPAADPAHPPLGVASLAGHLRRRGEEVELLDLNVLAYHRLLAAGHLARCAERMEARVAELEARPELPAAAAEEYRLLVENLLAADFLAAGIGEALEALRRPATYADRRRYAEASSRVRRAMELVSAAHYPLRWYPRGFSMSWLPTRSRDVLAATADRRQNLFLPLFEEVLAEHAAAPDVVGISINYYCQVIPGLTLAAAVRRRWPRARVVAGGGLLCFFDGRWRDLAPFAGLVDLWVPWEGELPLAALLAALGEGADPAAVPGVLSFAGGEPRLVPPPPPPDPRGLPPPDYDGLPLADYLAPEPVLPLLASRGCYWTRCAFCSHYQLFRGRFRMKTAEQVRAEMDHLAARHGCRTFYLSDEAVPPRIARGLAAAARQRGSAHAWFGESRFERALDAATLAELAAGGCRMLMFGLESAVPRVLARIDKGIDPAWAEQVLRGCAAAGVRAFVMFFLGFPGETREEAEATLAFVERLRGPITHVAFSNFILEHKSPVYREPGRYGITEILPYADEDLKIYSDYRVAEGLDSRQAVALLEEARERPGIRPLIDLYLVSRSHLVFLPPLEAAGSAELDEPSVDAAEQIDEGRVTDLGELRRRLAQDGRGERLFPLRATDLVPRKVAFDLSEIRRRVEANGDGEGAAVSRHEVEYVYSPSREALIDVGDDGLRLLAPCDGRFSLAAILEAVGEEGREAALGFYDGLAARGVLRWEARV
jgi:radical SAM superfamily enzyme YgiQ (UPF0313 family)